MKKQASIATVLRLQIRGFGVLEAQQQLDAEILLKTAFAISMLSVAGKNIQGNSMWIIKNNIN